MTLIGQYTAIVLPQYDASHAIILGYEATDYEILIQHGLDLDPFLCPLAEIVFTFPALGNNAL